MRIHHSVSCFFPRLAAFSLDAIIFFEGSLSRDPIHLSKGKGTHLTCVPLRIFQVERQAQEKK